MRLMSLISGIAIGAAPAQKKPPERLCPRGAEDTILFRERLDARRVAGRRPAAGVLLYPKRAAYVHASGQSLRGPQEGRRRDLPRCRPIHVDYRVSSSGRFPAAFPGRRCSIHEGGENRAFSFGVKADFSPCGGKKSAPRRRRGPPRPSLPIQGRFAYSIALVQTPPLLARPKGQSPGIEETSPCPK